MSAYQKMKERYGYTRSYDSFRKFVNRLKVKTVKKKIGNPSHINGQNILDKR